MSVYTLTPTAPTVEAGPIIDLALSMLGNDTFRLLAGTWGKYPQYWELISCRINLICDATVANRQIRIRSIDSITGQHENPGYISDVITATQERSFGLMPFNSAYANASPLLNSYISIGPDQIVYGGNNYLETIISGGQVGDTVTLSFKLKYKNPDLKIPTPYDQV